MNPNPQFTGEADPAVQKAYYRILYEAIRRADAVRKTHVLGMSELDAACVAYANAIPRATREMIERLVKGT